VTAHTSKTIQCAGGAGNVAAVGGQIVKDVMVVARLVVLLLALPGLVIVVMGLV